AADQSTAVLLWDLRGVGPREPARRADLAEAYRDLGAEDPRKAFRAVRVLAADPGRSVPYLEKRVEAVPGYGGRCGTQLIADLDADKFQIRERARVALTLFGEGVQAQLRAAFTRKGVSLELRERVGRLIRRLEANDLTEDQRRRFRVIAAL